MSEESHGRPRRFGTRAGQVVAEHDPAASHPKAKGTKGYDFTVVDVPGAAMTFVYALNNQGTVVGQGYDAVGEHGTAAIFEKGEHQVFSVPGAAGASLGAISARGALAGNYTRSDGIEIGFVFDHGTRRDFQATPNAILTQLGGLNDQGRIAGTYTEDPNYMSIHAFAGTPGRRTPFELPGDGVWMTQAFAINNRGDIVGWYADARGSHGYLRSGDTYTTIDHPGAFLTRTFGLNHHGEVVGYYQQVRRGPATGFVWRAGSVQTTITMAGATSTVPQGINDAGQIVGYFRDSNGGFHGFLATPVR